ncbi:WhiB family transcriptional regulator [Georgenia sp. SUBG003]|uniref:WhiB family transcriptional regulator n=1 Tax=Georgenia sp. SUBG003 TaxID=1497974 RepID=UPI0004D5BB72|nr:transcription factor WhiB [Georgenia sp. SUBG003]
MTQTMPWAREAACANTPPETLFVRGAAQRSAREICFSCPVRTACLVEALGSETEFGVWGGLTERERRALLRQNPGVTDWAKWLDANDLESEYPSLRAARIRAARALAGV